MNRPDLTPFIPQEGDCWFIARNREAGNGETYACNGFDCGALLPVSELFNGGYCARCAAINAGGDA